MGLRKERKAERRVRPDSKGRIALGKLAEGVSSYSVREKEGGVLELRPYREVPAGEKWLWENRKAMAMVQKGLKESAEGKVEDLGDFSKYADDEIE